MRTTKVDRDGTVRCPKCGATSFTEKRSAFGKVTLALLAPKRLKCNGCGRMLKRRHW